MMELKDVFAVGGTGIAAMFTIICSTGRHGTNAPV